MLGQDLDSGFDHAMHRVEQRFDLRLVIGKQVVGALDTGIEFHELHEGRFPDGRCGEAVLADLFVPQGGGLQGLLIQIHSDVVVDLGH